MTFSFEVLKKSLDLDRIYDEWIRFISTPVIGANLSNHPSKIRIEIDEFDNRDLQTIVIRDNDGIVAIAPFFIERGVFWLKISVLNLLKFRTKKLRLFGSSIILRDDCHHVDVYEFIFLILKKDFEFDQVFLHQIDCSHSFWDYINSDRLRKWGLRITLAKTEIANSHQILFKGQHDSYLSTLGKKSRQNIQRTTRKLFREENAELVKYENSNQVGKFLDDLDAVYKNSWQSKTFGYKPKNTQDDIDYHKKIADEGWFRSYILYVNETPVAFEHVFQYGNTYEFRECGYDTNWSSRGVGTIVINLALKDIFDNSEDEVVIDFGIGDAPYKQTFGNHGVRNAAVYLYPLTLKSAPIILQKLIIRIDRRVRQVIKLLNIENFVRNFLKKR